MSLHLEKEVLLILQDTTNDDPMPARDISELLNITDSATCPRTRKLIYNAMKNNGVAIGSCQNGYFIIRTGHEMQRYLNSLLKRQIGITERIDTVYHAFHAE
jgi:hypothetical protein